MWRDPVGRKLRLHYMAGLAAKLGLLHVHDGAIGELRHDHDVHKGRDGEKGRQPPPRRLFCKERFTPRRIARLDSQIPIGIRTRPTAKAIGRTTNDRIPM